jgi:hypothetical protein
VARRGLAWVLGLAAVGLLPCDGHATMREWLMERAGLDPAVLASLPSVRLQGMGNPVLSVSDEGNELNAYDFGGNVAGILEDGDRWQIDAWTGNYHQDYQLSAFESERRFGNGGARLVQRSENRALGLDVNWGFYQIANAAGDWRRIRGPLLSGLLNQRLGRVTAGVIIGLEQENESLLTDDFYGLRHSQNRWVGQFGATTALLGLNVGANWRFESGDVLGKGVDPSRYHEDAYTWNRPVNRYGAFVLLPRRGNIEGGLRVGLMDREGFERVKVSWSDDSPQNPSHTRYSKEAITFNESESDFGVLTRWRWYAGGDRLVGLEAGIQSGEFEVVEGVNFKGSERAGRSSADTYHAGVGASQRLMHGRLLMALEGRALLEDWETEDLESGADLGSARALVAGASLEYFASNSVLVRGGFQVASRDSDVDRPSTLSLEEVVSGGLSWLPQGGLIQVHAALRVERSRAKNDAAADLLPETTLASYSVAARLLP